MKCEEFIDKLDGMTGTDIPQDMEKHLAECEDCRNYYAVISALTPKVYPETPENMKKNVLIKVKLSEHFKAFITMKTKAWRIAASVAAVLAIVFGIITLGTPSPARAAERVIDKSLSRVGNVKSMVMQIDVRTTPKENFSDIGIEDDMVEHRLTLLCGNRTRWRLDKKEGRSIVFDGVTKYMWLPGSSLYVKGDGNSGFEEWFDILLDPEMTLLHEKVATKDNGTEYSANESENEIVLTADIKAKGDFTNPYSRNTSIEESDTYREIVFDKQTNLIKGMKIYVKDNSRKILVVDIKSVEYNVPVDEARLVRIPEGNEWRDVNAIVKTSGKFAGITAERAAKIILNAFENNDVEAAKEALIQYDINKMFNSMRGIKVIRLGKSFKSGEYAGVFVPCEIKLSDGGIAKYNIALRNDNSNKEWIVDGGF